MLSFKNYLCFLQYTTAWEVHLFYNNASDVPTCDDSGVHKGGFRAILKGSLLCRDNDIRYMVHGLRGSWIKKGVDPQEARIMAGELPVYLGPEGSDVRPDTAESLHEPKELWGTFTAIDGFKTETRPVLGSYQYLYDSIFDSIINGAAPFMSAEAAVAVMELIELAFESSKTGSVLPVSHWTL